MPLRLPYRGWHARMRRQMPRPRRSPARPRAGVVAHAGAQRDRSVFAVLICLYFLVLFPILRADRYYSDDLKRSLFGRNGWDSNGRPLTTLLMKLLQCYDHALVDISPFTQIAGVALLAFAGVLIARRFRIGSPMLAALVAFPLGAQPFFLENLSFKFDSLSMCLALLLALLPVVAARDDRRGWRLGGLALFASMCLYQPAICAYLVFVLLELVLMQIEDVSLPALVQRARARFLQFVASMLAYELIVGIHVNGWVRQHGEPIHDIRFLAHVGSNFARFDAFIGASFGVQWWRYFGSLIAVLAAVAVAVAAGYAARAWRERRRPSAVLLGVWATVLPGLAFTCALGPLPLLVDPPIVPRVLVGIGALLAAGLVVLRAALQRWGWSPRWAWSLAAMLAVGLCVLASAYGNALAAQSRYEDHIAARLADDVAALRASDGVSRLVIDGSAGYAPAAGHAADAIPLLRALVRPYLDAGEMFEAHNFLNYYIPRDGAVHVDTDPPGTAGVDAVLARAAAAPVVVRAAAYDLRVVGDTAVASFRAPRDDACPQPTDCPPLSAASVAGR